MSKTERRITARDVITVALLGGIGYIAYKFIKGDWTFPDILGAIGRAPGLVLPGDIGQGYTEGFEGGGLPGAIGGTIYNIARPGDISAGTDVHERTKQILQKQPDLTWKSAEHKAVAQVISEDILKNPWWALIPGLQGVTIGGGLGSMKRWGQYLETLPPQQKYEERTQEYQKRTAFILSKSMEISPAGFLTRVGAPLNILHMALTTPQKPATPIVKHTISKEPLYRKTQIQKLALYKAGKISQKQWAQSMVQKARLIKAGNY